MASSLLSKLRTNFPVRVVNTTPQWLLTLFAVFSHRYALIQRLRIAIETAKSREELEAAYDYYLYLVMLPVIPWRDWGPQSAFKRVNEAIPALDKDDSAILLGKDEPLSVADYLIKVQLRVAMDDAISAIGTKAPGIAIAKREALIHLKAEVLDAWGLGKKTKAYAFLKRFRDQAATSTQLHFFSLFRYPSSYRRLRAHPIVVDLLAHQPKPKDTSALAPAR